MFASGWRRGGGEQDGPSSGRASVVGIRPTRADELDRLRHVVARGRERAAVATVRGGPGIGKSWLVNRLFEVDGPAIAAAGTTVLRVLCHPAETELPFAGLHQLLLPVQPHLAALPRPQRTAIEQALAREPMGAGPRFATAVGLHGLLTSLSERQPVLVIVEDGHWLDTSTMTCLVFAARRLDADRVAVVLTSRDAEHPTGLGGDDIVLPLLDHASARRILRQQHPDLDPGVTDEIVRIAAGLPVVLCEGPADLSPAQRRGEEPLPAVLPIGSTLSWLYRHRLAAIGPEGRLALAVMSLERLEEHRLARALATLGLDTGDLDAAEEHGLVERSGGGRALSHATVAAAVQAGVDPSDLDRARAAVASALTDQPHRQVWFLDASTDAHDTQLATQWDAAADHAQRRGAWAEAATAHEHAARRSGQPEDGRTRLAAAAGAHARAGAPAPLLRLLDELVAGATSPDERLLLEAQRITARAWSHPQRIDPHEVRRVICSQPDASRHARSVVLSALAVASLVWGDHPSALAAIDEAMADLDPDEATLADRLVRDLVEITAGRAGAGTTLLGEWLDEMSDEQLLDPTVPMFLASFVLVLIDELDAAMRVAGRLRTVAERVGDLSQLGLATALFAAVEQRRGDILAARAHYTTANQLCLDTAFMAPVPHLQLRHASLLAALGQEAACRSMIADSVAGGHDSIVMRHMAAWALGLLELTLGDCGKAVQHLDEADELLDEMGVGEPGYTTQAGDLVEALWRLRRLDEAHDAHERHRAGAERLQRHSALAIAARCRGLLADAPASTSRSPIVTTPSPPTVCRRRAPTCSGACACGGPAASTTPGRRCGTPWRPSRRWGRRRGRRRRRRN